MVGRDAESAAKKYCGVIQMTNKEAIEVIKTQKESYENNPNIVVADELYEAMDMAMLAIQYVDRAHVLLNKALKEEEGTWIPCNVKLPKKEGSVLASIETRYEDYISHYVAKVWWNGSSWWHNYHKKVDDIDFVLAWMPLPEPYKEGDSE